MGFLIGVAVLFVFIWIIAKAFSSNETEVREISVDPRTGREVQRIRKEVRPSSGRSAARVTLFIAFGLPVLIFGLLVIVGMSSESNSMTAQEKLNQAHSTYPNGRSKLQRSSGKSRGDDYRFCLKKRYYIHTDYPERSSEQGKHDFCAWHAGIGKFNH